MPRVEKRREKAAPQGKTQQAGKRPILYPEVTVRMCLGENPLTVEQARQLLGWEEETAGVQFGPRHLVEVSRLVGRKIRCSNNINNRPIYKSDIESLQQEILRKRWRLNGETIIIGQSGLVLNGQHTLLGLILAEMEWA